jgi:hypothetical protein
VELILRPNRIRYAKLLIQAGLYVAVGLFIVKHHQREAAMPITLFVGWSVIVFFGLAGILVCVNFVPGSAYLKLDQKGFTICSAFRPHSFRWYEVDSFEVGRLLRVMGRKAVGVNFSKLHQGQESLRKFNSKIAGYEGILADDYGMPAEKLASTLNEWRRRAGDST